MAQLYQKASTKKGVGQKFGFMYVLPLGTTFGWIGYDVGGKIISEKKGKEYRLESVVSNMHLPHTLSFRIGSIV